MALCETQKFNGILAKPVSENGKIANFSTLVPLLSRSESYIILFLFSDPHAGGHGEGEHGMAGATSNPCRGFLGFPSLCVDELSLVFPCSWRSFLIDSW